MDTQVDLSGAKKGISPGASGWHDGGGSSCTAGFPVCSCQSFIAVSGILEVTAFLLSCARAFMEYAHAVYNRELALYAYGQEDGEPDVRLMRLTPVSAPFGIAAFRSSYVVNGCVMHKWIGYSGDGTGEDWERQEEELVYITKSGEAYHRERSCLYLNPSIRLADREEITADYTPCSVCVGRGRLENRLIYVTDGGSRYHNTVSCSGLRRTIESVTLMQALEMGRHACPRCG